MAQSVDDGRSLILDTSAFILSLISLGPIFSLTEADTLVNIFALCMSTIACWGLSYGFYCVSDDMHYEYDRLRKLQLKNIEKDHNNRKENLNK